MGAAYNMNERRIPLEKEEPKHKKKSTGNGLPRSKHKHIYETVLLTKYYHRNDFRTGKPVTTEYVGPYKVCNICGRVEGIDKDPKYYIKHIIHDLPIKVYDKELSEEALTLPKWYCDDFWDKFAYKGE
jgi:hypothetical protein